MSITKWVGSTQPPTSETCQWNAAVLPFTCSRRPSSVEFMRSPGAHENKWVGPVSSSYRGKKTHWDGAHFVGTRNQFSVVGFVCYFSRNRFPPPRHLVTCFCLQFSGSFWTNHGYERKSNRCHYKVKTFFLQRNQTRPYNCWCLIEIFSFQVAGAYPLQRELHQGCSQESN